MSELERVYAEGADALAVVLRENERLRAAMVQLLKLTVGRVPFSLAMEVGSLLGVPGLATTSPQPPK